MKQTGKDMFISDYLLHDVPEDAGRNKLGLVTDLVRKVRYSYWDSGD